MNVEKLKQLEAQVRIGGKGSARRKKKVIHRTNATDDKRLQSSLKKLGLTNIPGIEEVNMIKDDGEVIHFNNPKVQASLSSNTFAVTGHAEVKKITEMLPTLLSQLNAESFSSALKKLVASSPNLGGNDDGDKNSQIGVDDDVDDDEDEVPELVGNFDDASKAEVS